MEHVREIKQDLPRINNSLEGWHCSFFQSLPAHPDLTLLAARLQKEQDKLSINRAHYLTVRKRPTSRKKYQLISKKLKTLVGTLDNGVFVGIHFLDAEAKVVAVNILA